MASRVTADGIIQSTKTVPVEEIMLGEFFERLFTENADKIGAIDTETGKQYTFGELLRICKSLGAVLQQRGVKPHDVVVVGTRTSFRACCIILALLFCQATIVPTVHSFTVYEFSIILKNLPPLKLAIGDGPSTATLREASALVDVADIETLWDTELASSFIKPPNSDPKSHIMLIVLTSGSTGPSKRVCMSHYNMMGNMCQWDPYFVRFLMCAPLWHMSAFLVLNFTLWKAQTLVVASEKLTNDVNAFVDVCAKYKIESILAMPALFNGLTKFGDVTKMSSVKRVVTGGSHIPQAVINEFRSMYPNVTIGFSYGTSEGGLVLRSADPNKIHLLQLLPNVQVKILDLNTKEVLGPHRNGMLYYKAPSVAVGYHNDKKANDETFIDGWNVTGDVAYSDEEGCIVIVDRLKQMIKCMDSQVAPADLEFLLTQEDQVLKVVVGGVPHAEFGEAAVAFVVPRKSANLTELRERLLQEVKAKCVFHKHLHGGLYFVDSIPTTNNGKFSRKDMVSMHLKKQIKYLD